MTSIHLLLFLLTPCFALKRDIIADVTPNNLKQCLNALTSEYFHYQTTIIIKKRNTDIYHHSSTLLEDLSSIIYIRGKLNNAIITYTDLQHLQDIFTAIKDSYCFDSRAPYIIIANSPDELKNVTEILWSYRVYKSTILLDNRQENQIDIYQIDFSLYQCGKVIQPVKINVWKNNKFLLKKDKLFKPNFEEYARNCTLRVVYSEFKPWISLKEEHPGVFVKIVEIFSQYTQIQLEYLPENPIYQQELQEEYSHESVHQDLDSGLADIYLGLGNNLPYLIMEVTDTIYDDRIYFIAPKPTQMPFWRAMFHIFTLLYWCFMLFQFFVAVTLLTLQAQLHDENRFKSFEYNLIYLFAHQISTSPGKGSSTRALNAMIYSQSLISLLFCTFFQARLFDILRHPLYENDVRSIEQMVDSGMPIVFSDGLSVLFLFTGPTNQRIYDTYTGSNLTMGEETSKMVKMQNYVTMADTGVMILMPQLDKFVNVIDLVYFQICFYMRKHHELFDIFNWKLKQVVENGVVNKIVSEAKWYYTLKDEMKLQEKKEFFALSVKHCEGGFLMLVCGLGCATIVFVCELIWGCIIQRLWNKRQRTRKINVSVDEDKLFGNRVEI